MKLLVDSADIHAIRQSLACGYVAGVTTNPTLLRRAGVRPAGVGDLVAQCVAAGAREIHVQVYAEDAAGMCRDAQQLDALAPGQIWVKLPATPAGFQAAAQLAAAGLRVTLTAVYTLRQALLAESVGAACVAIYLGRMRDAGTDALALAGQMQALLRAQSARTHILAASIRDPDELPALAALGLAAATVAPAVLAAMPESPATAQAAATFATDTRAIVAGEP